MNIKMKDIEQYLSDVREAVENDRYRIDRNSRRKWEYGGGHYGREEC